jgi:hypothetical protein
MTLTASEGEDEQAELGHTKGEEDMDVCYFEEWDRTVSDMEI